MKIVVKFGGSSLASAKQFKKVADIIRADKGRKYVVPSAPGKRNDKDEKVTDLLYQCYDAASQGKSYKKILDKIRERYEEMLNTARTDPSISEIYPNPEDYVVYFLRWEGWRWFEREENVWEGFTPGTEYMAVGAPFNVNGFEQGAGKLATAAFTTPQQ